MCARAREIGYGCKYDCECGHERSEDEWLCTSNMGFFCINSWPFCKNAGLFCKNTGLLRMNIGLFCMNIGSVSMSVGMSVRVGVLQCGAVCVDF